MCLFTVFLQPFLTKLERECGGDLCVAYADDITVIATSSQAIIRMLHLFARYEAVSGAKLNRQKTVTMDVGSINGNPLAAAGLQTVEKMKVLGVVFTNSVRRMVKLNWDALLSRTSQLIWLHSMRSLNLQQKIILLNTFITSKVWYISSIIPPLCAHTAKLTSIMGNFLFRGLPARIPMQQLARSREKGGLRLQLPAMKCKALLVNRHLQEIVSIPYYQSILAQNIPPPTEFPCLKLLSQQIPLLPQLIHQNPSSDQIYRFYLEQTDPPRVERNQPGLPWKRIWLNISSKRLSSSERSDLYQLINEKTEHRLLMNTIGRANDSLCQHCRSIETLQHKFCECPRVAAAWTFFQARMMQTLGGWHRPTFNELTRPILYNIPVAIKTKILKSSVKYINYVNTNVNNNLNVVELDFILNLED